jgi:3-oxoadipate enol-lactonase
VGRTRFARRGGGRIAYELRFRRWRSRPRLVLVQGLGFDRSGWDPVLPGLGRHLDLVLVDNRGSGRSGTSPSGITVADLARDVVAVLDRARIPRAHLLGASLGGMVAQELAIDHPERVDRLVLACTTPGWPYAYPMPSQSTRLLTATRSLPRKVALRRNVENALSAQTVRDRPELVERLVRHQQARPNDPAAWTALATAGARFSGNLRQQRIRARTLVLHGDADTVVDPRNSALLARRIPRAELVTLPGLGHLFFWEDPEAFVDAVVGFLTARDEPS